MLIYDDVLPRLVSICMHACMHAQYALDCWLLQVSFKTCWIIFPDPAGLTWPQVCIKPPHALVLPGTMRRWKMLLWKRPVASAIPWKLCGANSKMHWTQTRPLGSSNGWVIWYDMVSLMLFLIDGIKWWCYWCWWNFVYYVHVYRKHTHNNRIPIYFQIILPKRCPELNIP